MRPLRVLSKVLLTTFTSHRCCNGLKYAGMVCTDIHMDREETGRDWDREREKRGRACFETGSRIWAAALDRGGGSFIKINRVGR